MLCLFRIGVPRVSWAVRYHIVPFGKFHRMGGAPPETFPIIKYDAPEEVSGERNFFDSPLRKVGLVQI